MSSESLHEAAADLRSETVDRHRAITSLMEELEAVDWYDQRIDAANDDELREILRHNRDEEKEHASMLLEWLRKRDPALDGHLREYLFTEHSIPAEEASATAEAGAEGGASGGVGGTGSLSIGPLREKDDL